MIERVVGPARCPRAAAKKVALGHVFLFPSYAFLFNVWMGALEGKGAEGGVRKFMDTWAEVCVAGSVFWPAANTKRNLTGVSRALSAHLAKS